MSLLRIRYVSKHIATRKHSSRMRTARLLTRRGGCFMTPPSWYLPFIEPPSWYPFTAIPPSWNPLQGNPPGQHTPCGQTNTSENITFLQLCLLVVIKMEIFRYMFLKIHTDIRMPWLLQCKIGFSLLSYACCCLQKCYCRLKPKHM